MFFFYISFISNIIFPFSYREILLEQWTSVLTFTRFSHSPRFPIYLPRFLFSARVYRVSLPLTLLFDLNQDTLLALFSCQHTKIPRCEISLLNADTRTTIFPVDSMVIGSNCRRYIYNIHCRLNL